MYRILHEVSFLCACHREAMAVYMNCLTPCCWHDVMCTYMYSSILVKLFMTVCPGIDTRGPTWYKLEALSDETKKLEGTFGAPPLRSEAILTDNNAVSNS